ncbi:MAG: pseudouridine synthase [Nitrosopumilus sp.]|nr:pseudouridine synthase [Nitrosopumilus sp.]
MSTQEKIIPIANQILKKHELCDNCLGRLFSKKLHLSSNKLLGKKLQKNSKSKHTCYICKNIFDDLPRLLKSMTDASSQYSFKSFSVGVMVKPSIVDRDDVIRSKFKLRGIDSIKTDISKELAKAFSRKTKKILDTVDSDVTFTLNLKDDTCYIRAKSIVFSGRYVKSARGIPQKQKSCGNCLGKGCRLCNFHGISEFNSIEGIISKFLFEKLGGTTAKFTWIGGEDKTSLVLGKGRPFFVKIQNPNKRTLRSFSIKSEFVQISNLKIIRGSPKQPLKFKSIIKMKIYSDSKINSNILLKLKTLTKQPIVVYETSGKRSEKKIFSLKYKKISKNDFTLLIKADGGLPVKRFVSGDDVSPSISKIFKRVCTCKEFDFLDVEV